MKVNYVLMYGTPYLKYREFETFEDASKFLVNKSIVNYSIFKKLEDDKEVEMIYRDNDIRYLEQENKKLNNIINDVYEFVEWHYKDNQKFYKNKGIGLNYPECDYILDKLKELKENDK